MIGRIGLVRPRNLILAGALVVIGAGLAVALVAIFYTPNVGPYGWYDEMQVSFQITAIHANNGSVYFVGSITNSGTHSITGMRILINGTGLSGDWIVTYTPGFPSPGRPLTPGAAVKLDALLPSGAPHGGWPMACQSFTCKAGDKLLLEVDFYDGRGGMASQNQLIAIGTA